MSEQKESCSILMFSKDMEWMNAFIKGLQRFYLVDEQKVETFDAFTEKAKENHPHFIVVYNNAEVTVEKVKQILNDNELHIPVLAVEPAPTNPLDALIKQGADYAVVRRDLLSAIKYAQQIMRLNKFHDESRQALKAQQAMKERYVRIYDDLPDPIAYIQDGLFIDANNAFINTFGINDRKKLEENTLMTFTPPKSERALKAFLKKATDKDMIPAEKIEFQKLNGEPVEVLLSVANVHIEGEKALQLYFRMGGGGAAGSGSALDITTKLPYSPVVQASLHQAQEKAQAGDLLGYWVYLLIDNYREVWQRDGYKTAEILVKATAEATQRFLPPSTEIVRFTDDALAMWLASDDKEGVIQRVKGLITRLDEIIPENVGRMITPKTFAGMFEIRQETPFDELCSKGFRAAKALTANQNGERVAEPMSGNMSRKDEKRVHQLKQIVAERRIKVKYQPIASLEADGIPRYAERLILIPTEAEKDDFEVEAIMQVADRYGFSRELDQLKISTLTADFLSYTGDQKALQLFIGLSNSALSDEALPEWLEGQFRQTGVAFSQLVFGFNLDTFTSAYSGIIRLVERLRPLGVKFALTELGRYDDEVKDIMKRLKPEVLSIDMRELDTFEAEEEERFMNGLKAYASENNCLLYVDHMEGANQLSRVWPYDIQYLQGDGIVAPLDKFTYNFNEPLF